MPLSKDIFWFNRQFQIPVRLNKLHLNKLWRTLEFDKRILAKYIFQSKNFTGSIYISLTRAAQTATTLIP